MRSVHATSFAGAVGVQLLVLGLLMIGPGRAPPGHVTGAPLATFDIALPSPDPAPEPPAPDPRERSAGPTPRPAAAAPPPALPPARVAQVIAPRVPTSSFAKVQPTLIPASATTRTSASPVAAPAAEADGATSPSPSAPSGRSPDYAGRVAAWLERHKSYPSALAREGRDALVVVRFRVDRRGRAEAIELVRGSGIAWLDHVALDQVGDAAPYPRPPNGLSAQDRTFEVPLRYRARG